MSKRFGRNQRRRMREQIAAMNTAALHSNMVAGNLRARVSDLEHVIGYMRSTLVELLGANTVAVPPAHIGRAREDGDRLHLPVWGRLPAFGARRHRHCGHDAAVPRSWRCCMGAWA